MKLLADECCDYRLFRFLRERGFDILHISDNRPGISDAEVLDLAISEQRILITQDKDHGELAVRMMARPAHLPGIILLRDISPDIYGIAARLADFLSLHPALASRLVVMERERFRVRQL